MDLLSQISLEKDQKKQKQLIIAFMKSTNFEHPLITPILSEFKLVPEDLQPSQEPPNEIFSNRDQKSSSISNKEVRRQAKIEVISEIIQQRNLFSHKNYTNSRKTLTNSPSKNIKSYKTILESVPDLPLSIPLSQITVPERLIEKQQKKLERLLKVSENLKLKKIEEEKRKMDLNKELDKKTEKFKQNQIAAEEERNKKKNEADTKRQSKLRKKYEVGVK